VRERPPEPLPRAEVGAPRSASRKRRRGRIALACAAGVAVAAAIAYVVSSHDDNARRVDPAAAGAPRRSAPSSKPATATKTTATAAPHEKRRHAATSARPARRAAARSAPTSKRRRSRKPGHAVVSSSGFVPARTWTWPRSPGAHAYETQFQLDGRLVLRVRTTRPRLVLPRTFRFHAGTYRWTVEPVPAAANRRPIVDSKFVLTRAAAARANP
jgi:hypothetical protein